MGFNNLQIRRPPGPKVLVVGLADGEQNQFTRKIEDLGCEVTRLTGDPGDVPGKYDACVLIKCAISHAKFWATKEIYKGKRLFVTDRGFSPIKDSFEEFVFNFKPEGRSLGDQIEDVFRNSPPTKSLMSRPPSAYYKPSDTIASVEDRFARAQGHVQKLSLPIVKPKAKLQAVDIKKEIEAQLPIADTGRGKQIVKECFIAGMSVEETIAMLKAENVVRKNGTEFTKNDVSYYRTQTKRELDQDSEVKEQELNTYDMDPNTIVESTPVEKVSADYALAESAVDIRVKAPTKIGLSINDLLTSVLTGTHTMERKLELIAQINSGAITKTSGINTEVVGGEIGITRFDLSNAENNQAFWLTVNEAQLIIDASAEILDFVIAEQKKQES